MKRSFLLLTVLFIVTFAFTSCSENLTGSQQNSSTDALEQGNLYISAGDGYGSGFDDPVVFYILPSEPNVIHSTLPPAAQIVGASVDPNNREFGIFKLKYLSADTFNVPARLTPYKYSEMPTYSSTHPYNGVSVVKNRQLVLCYDEAQNNISVFNLFTGELKNITANRTGDTVYLADNRRLEPHVFNPDPATTNLHYWFDGWVTRSTSFCPFRSGKK
ncbi:MAG: hypothetical protein NTY12_01085 [Candidatus Falkowbacteria bacterium]|nr:hypothetical protein [Candidatus Falkowbacteria bacterium]